MSQDPSNLLCFNWNGTFESQTMQDIHGYIEFQLWEDITQMSDIYKTNLIINFNGAFNTGQVVALPVVVNIPEMKCQGKHLNAFDYEFNLTEIENGKVTGTFEAYGHTGTFEVERSTDENALVHTPLCTLL